MQTLIEITLSNVGCAALITVAAFVTGKWFRRPALAHALGVLALLKLFTPPLYVTPLPGGQFEWEPNTEVAPALDETVEVFALAADEAAPTGATESAAAAVPPPPPAEEISESGWPWALIGLAVWAFGSAAVFLVSMVRIVRFHGGLRKAGGPAPADLRRRAEHAAHRIGLHRPPEVLLVAARLSPMVWGGLGRARVYFPRDLAEKLSGRKIELLLAHEFAHVKRRDYLVRWLELAARCAYWWNPLVWWTQRQLRVNEEQCCDALVVRRLAEGPRDYAAALWSAVEYLAGRTTSPPALASGLGSGGLVRRRFQMILRNNQQSRMGWFNRIALLAVAAAALPFSMSLFADEEGDEGEGKKQIRIVIVGEDGKEKVLNLTGEGKAIFLGGEEGAKEGKIRVQVETDEKVIKGEKAEGGEKRVIRVIRKSGDGEEVEEFEVQGAGPAAQKIIKLKGDKSGRVIWAVGDAKGGEAKVEGRVIVVGPDGEKKEIKLPKGIGGVADERIIISPTVGEVKGKIVIVGPDGEKKELDLSELKGVHGLTIGGVKGVKEDKPAADREAKIRDLETKLQAIQAEIERLKKDD